jgi:lipoate-protein ligase A
MWLLKSDFATAAENLAFDEALVESADAWTAKSPAPVETLRLWEMSKPVVVLGRGSKISEVREDECRRDGVPILRRCSGGASIVAGTGCLMYSLLLSLEARPALRDLSNSHEYVMNRVLAAVRMSVARAKLDGTCDITVDGRKCSGNAVRYKRNWMLYHGTLLYAFDLSLVSRYSAMPARQPNYRAGRSHEDFLANLDCSRDSLEANVLSEFSVESSTHPFQTHILKTMTQLLSTKYSA